MPLVFHVFHSSWRLARQTADWVADYEYNICLNVISLDLQKAWIETLAWKMY